jgi:hypothetical protein
MPSEASVFETQASAVQLVAVIDGILVLVFLGFALLATACLSFADPTYLLHLWHIVLIAYSILICVNAAFFFQPFVVVLLAIVAALFDGYALGVRWQQISPQLALGDFSCLYVLVFAGIFLLFAFLYAATALVAVPTFGCFNVDAPARERLIEAPVEEEEEEEGAGGGGDDTPPGSGGSTEAQFTRQASSSRSALASSPSRSDAESRRMITRLGRAFADAY